MVPLLTVRPAVEKNNNFQLGIFSSNLNNGSSDSFNSHFQSADIFIFSFLNRIGDFGLFPCLCPGCAGKNKPTKAEREEGKKQTEKKRKEAAAANPARGCSSPPPSPGPFWTFSRRPPGTRWAESWCSRWTWWRSWTFWLLLCWSSLCSLFSPPRLWQLTAPP